MNKITDAELEAAARIYHSENRFSRDASLENGFIAGAKWQADQYAEALQLMREMAEAMNNWKIQVEAHGGEYLPGNAIQICSVLEKDRASRWSEEK